MDRLRGLGYALLEKVISGAANICMMCLRACEYACVRVCVFVSGGVCVYVCMHLCVCLCGAWKVNVQMVHHLPH